MKSLSVLLGMAVLIGMSVSTEVRAAGRQVCNADFAICVAFPARWGEPQEGSGLDKSFDKTTGQRYWRVGAGDVTGEMPTTIWVYQALPDKTFEEYFVLARDVALKAYTENGEYNRSAVGADRRTVVLAGLGQKLSLEVEHLVINGFKREIVFFGTVTPKGDWLFGRTQNSRVTAQIADTADFKALLAGIQVSQ